MADSINAFDSWAGKETNCLVLNYTLACPLHCAFCCYGCSPKRQEKMPLALASNLIDQAAQMGVFSSVGFTGGEAMLFEEEIRLLAKRLQGHGLRFTLATSGHWAVNLKAAHTSIAILAERGLCRLNLSYDHDHAAHIPAQNILNAATACQANGVPCYVIGTFDHPDDTLENLLPELADFPCVSLASKTIAEIGRAKRRQPDRQPTLQLDDLACYRRQYHDIAVFWDGLAYPCCSTFNRATPGLVLGDTTTTSLQQIYEMANGSTLLRILKRKGFSRLYEVIKETDNDVFSILPKIDGCNGPCSLCNKLLSDDGISKKIKSAISEYEIKLFGHLLNDVGDLIGEKMLTQYLSILETEGKNV